MKKLTRMLRVMVALVAVVMPAGATTLRQMSFEELARRAERVVRVRCLETRSGVEQGEIWTWTTFEVVETLKGNDAQRITVRTIGGRWGHLVSHVEGVPRFQGGEEAYLFLEATHTQGERGAAERDFSVTGWMQGTFHIERHPETQRESVSQDTSGVTIFDPRTRQFREGEILRMGVNEFRQRVRAALSSDNER